jgi:hypothetical protein
MRYNMRLMVYCLKSGYHSSVHLLVTVLSKAIDDHTSPLAPLRGLRQVQYERLKKELFEKDKDARLRSGTRGMAARKALIAQEKIVAESSER